jgi:N-acyl-phosphatidylethanolamine-hydrolysing phospholipase D
MSRGRYRNPHVQDRWSLLAAFLWKSGYYQTTEANLSPPFDFIYPAVPGPFIRTQPHAVWIGHSTYLIEIDGVILLTDPVWDQYCSPVPLRALRRFSEPPIALADLPPVDIVLLSHNHYDHLDVKTVQALSRFHPQIQWVVPEGLSHWFKKRGIQSVTELPRWKSLTVKDCKITAVPAQHFSGRTLWDRNNTHWNGYVAEVGQKKIYFVGDTGYNPFDFKEIGERLGPMDLSLIPIGSYLPKEFMRPVHVCPYEAVQIHQEVHSRLSLGMHWNTFCLSDEPFDRPPYDLFLAMQEKKLPFETFLPIDIGSYINF